LTNYIKFDEDFNEFTVFNMCYIADALGKVLLAYSMGCKAKLVFLDFEDENYFITFFENISIDDRQEICYEQRFKKAKRITPTPHWFLPKGERIAYHELFHKFFILKPSIKENFSNEYYKIRRTAGGRKVIGVVSRGTDYLIKKPTGHPVQPTIEELILEINKNVSEEDFLYLATEEKVVLERFQREFKGRILVSDSMYYDEIYNSENKHISQFSFNRDNDKYKRGFEYFQRVFILSKCDGLIAGMNGAVRAALIMKDGDYEIEKIINHGFYR